MAELEEIAQIAASLAMAMSRSPETMNAASTVNTLTQDGLARVYEERRKKEEKKRKLSKILGTVGSVAGTAIGGPIGGTIGGTVGEVAGGAKPMESLASNALNAGVNWGMNKVSGAIQSKQVPLDENIKEMAAPPLQQPVGQMIGQGVLGGIANKAQGYVTDYLNSSPYNITREPGPTGLASRYQGTPQTSGKTQGISEEYLPQKGFKDRLAETFTSPDVQMKVQDIINSITNTGPSVEPAKIPFGLGSDRVAQIDDRYNQQAERERLAQSRRDEMSLRERGLDIQEQGLELDRQRAIEQGMQGRAEIGARLIGEDAQTERVKIGEEGATDRATFSEQQASQRQFDRFFQDMVLQDDQQAFMEGVRIAQQEYEDQFRGEKIETSNPFQSADGTYFTQIIKTDRNGNQTIDTVSITDPRNNEILKGPVNKKATLEQYPWLAAIDNKYESLNDLIDTIIELPDTQYQIAALYYAGNDPALLENIEKARHAYINLTQEMENNPKTPEEGVKRRDVVFNSVTGGLIVK